jgi:DNA-binding PadR family transcriptional regulator
MLRDGPAHSYELAARIRALLGPGFDINTGQMSRLTKALLEKELIALIADSAEPMPRAGADRRVYAITPKGAEEYEDFFEKGPNETKLFRRSILVKIGLAGAERLGEIPAQIGGYEQHCLDRINELKRELDEILPDDDAQPHVDRVVLRLGIEADIAQLKAELAWARHARHMVSWLLSTEAIWPSSPTPRPQRSDPAQQAERENARRQLLQRLAARNRPDEC